jgi:hypothetical protein
MEGKSTNIVLKLLGAVEQGFRVLADQLPRSANGLGFAGSPHDGGELPRV